jgi:hypothetical protein
VLAERSGPRLALTWCVPASPERLPFFPVAEATSSARRSGDPMPLIRYFIVIGGALLALLFLADRYMDGPASAAAPAGPDVSIARIRSTQTWPEKIVFDTSVRQIPLSKVVAVTPPSAPVTTAASTTPESTRQAFAMVTPPAVAPKQAAPAVPNKRVAERHRRGQPLRMPARGQTMFFNQPVSAGW